MVLAVQDISSKMNMFSQCSYITFSNSVLHPIGKPRKPYLEFSSFIYVDADRDAFQKSAFGSLFLKILPAIGLLLQNLLLVKLSYLNILKQIYSCK